MRYKMTYLCILLFVLRGNTFGFSAGFYDYFYIENRTRQKIVLEFEGNRYPSHYLRYDYDDGRYVLLSFAPGANDPDKYFRTVKSKGLFHKGLYKIGESRHNYEDFNNKTPEEKFSAFFSSISIFNERGDLLYYIDDFSKCRIEDRGRRKEHYSKLTVLVIERVKRTRGN